MENKKVYTIDKLASIAGVSVRTLRHYDQIGLLFPTTRNNAGHRVYGKNELFKLQQILFYKELEFSLSDIKKIFDQNLKMEEILLSQRNLLVKEQERFGKLIKTLDKTILFIKEQKMTNDKTMLSDEELYEGFSKEQIAEYKKEASERWPDKYKESYDKVRKLSKEQWQTIKEEGDNVTRGLAALMDRQPNDPEVQALVKRHYDWIGNFYTPTKEIYKGLGEMYVADSRFTATYDKYAKGLALFLKEAIDFYCENSLD